MEPEFLESVELLGSGESIDKSTSIDARTLCLSLRQCWQTNNTITPSVVQVIPLSYAKLKAPVAVALKPGFNLPGETKTSLRITASWILFHKKCRKLRLQQLASPPTQYLGLGIRAVWDAQKIILHLENHGTMVY